MNKIIYGLLTIMTCYVIASCANADAHYIDLNSGKRVELEKDPGTGMMVNTETRKPVYLYVDTRTNDTINGRTGMVVNQQVVKTGTGKYRYSGDVETDHAAYTLKEPGYKLKVEKKGEIKLKTGHVKVKYNKKGERKEKRD
jgi:hypothetical protein